MEMPSPPVTPNDTKPKHLNQKCLNKYPTKKNYAIFYRFSINKKKKQKKNVYQYTEKTARINRYSENLSVYTGITGTT